VEGTDYALWCDEVGKTDAIEGRERRAENSSGGNGGKKGV
jgi:hypothetical protein